MITDRDLNISEKFEWKKLKMKLFPAFYSFYSPVWKFHSHFTFKAKCRLVMLNLLLR